MQKPLPKNAGVAMVLTLCAAALFLSLTAALVYGGSVLLAAANRPLTEEKTYQQAKTFSEALGARLMAAPAADGTAANDLQACFNDFVVNANGLPYIDGQNYTLTDLSADSTDENYGTVELTLCKNAVADYETSFAAKDSIEKCKTLEGAFTDYEVRVTVTVTQGRESNRYYVVYDHNARYKVHYFIAQGQEIFHNDDATAWYYDAGKTRPASIDDTDTITVTYGREGADATITYTRKGADHAQDAQAKTE